MPGQHALNEIFRDGIFLKKHGEYPVAEYLLYCVVIGDFPYGMECAPVVETSPRYDHVDMRIEIGQIAECLDRYRRAGCYVIPSRGNLEKIPYRLPAATGKSREGCRICECGGRSGCWGIHA